MQPRFLLEFVLLAALWGASFMFMRIASPEFGAFALVEIRVAVAALFLLPFVLAKKGLGIINQYRLPIFVVALTNTAIPYTLFAFATLTLTAGFTSITNSTAPLWTALIAFFWFRHRLSASGLLGLLIGFIGVTILISDKLSFDLSEFSFAGEGVAVVAAFTATFLYGIAINYSKTKLQGVDSLSITTGSLIFSAIALLPLAIYYWPAQSISFNAWASVLVMGVACTALALILYFRLIVNIGPTKTITVTYLIPVFGMLFGQLFLDEVTTVSMIVGCALILLGTGLTMGLLKFPTNKKAIQR